MFIFKKSLIFSIALIVVGLVPFIISTNSLEAKAPKEHKIIGGPNNAWDLPAGNYDDRDQNDSTQGPTPTPTPPPAPEPVPKKIVDPTEDPDWPEHLNRTGD